MQETHRPSPTQASGLRARVEAHFMILQTEKWNNIGESNYEKYNLKSTVLVNELHQ
jgi:hypothetical protein